MVLIIRIFIYSSCLLAFSEANCFDDPQECPAAAVCSNTTGTPACVCGSSTIGNGKNCYGYCTDECNHRSGCSCHKNSLGFSCLCSSSDQSKGKPGNGRLVWHSSTALIATWDYVQNAYFYKAKLSNSNWESRQYTSYIPFAGFEHLSPDSTYNLTVQTQQPGALFSDTSVFEVKTDTAPDEETILCDSKPCEKATNECESENRCHTEATCRDVDNGYVCTCNDGYVGNGTYCIGVCSSSCQGSNRRCFPTQFGNACVCTRRNLCSVPSTPSNLRVVLQTPDSLAFEWTPVGNAVSYKAVLTSTEHSKFRNINYDTERPWAAYSNLQPGKTYKVEVNSYSVAHVNQKKVSITATTVIAKGPELNVTEVSSADVSVTFNKVKGAVAYELEYYSDTKNKLYKNSSLPSFLLKNLESKKTYKFKVYVVYDAGKSNGSDVASIYIEEHCYGEICLQNATCNQRTKRCECAQGFDGDGIRQCKKIYGLPFRQVLKNTSSSSTNAISLTIQRELSDLYRTRIIIDVNVEAITNRTARFLLFTTDPDLSFDLKVDSEFESTAEPLKDVCITANVSGFTFAETNKNTIQNSTEVCWNDKPLANASCVFTPEFETRFQAYLLRSEFNASSVKRAPCSDPPTSDPSLVYTAPSVPEVEVIVSPEALEMAISQLNISGLTPDVTIVVHQNTTYIGQRFPSDKNVSAVITIDIGENTTIENLTNPILIVNPLITSRYGDLEPPKSDSKTLFRDQIIQECVYWNEKTMEWSGEGCCLNNNLYPPTCECNHLSSFAIIVSTVPIPADIVLDVLSTVGCSLSALGLAATFLILILYKEARIKVPNIIQLHFTVCLFITYVIFLTGISQVEISTLCTVIAALLQYFFLASWLWLGIYSLKLYFSLAYVFSQTGNYFIHKCCVVAYGVPLLIVGLNVGITIGYFDRTVKNEQLCNPDDPIIKKSYYRAENMCWLQDYSLYIGFLLIVGLVLLNNIVVLVLVTRMLFRKKNIRSTRAKRSKFSELISALSLSFTLGLCWVFGFLMLLSSDITYNRVMYYLFSIFTATQGFAVWFFTCIRRKDVKDFWWLPIKQMFVRIGAKVCCQPNWLTRKASSDGNSKTEKHCHSTSRLTSTTL